MARLSKPNFSKVLVANRGEIAVRIITCAQGLGYPTVAVFSDADAQAPHVRLADEAVYLGPSPAAESYLNVAALLDAAARSGADAVHPGYGFLAESAEFARGCVEAGLVFIGPSPEAIALMGDKVQAKRHMAAAGVPMAPGTHGSDLTHAGLLAQGRVLGVPLLVKAVAGGGGRGMRKVTELSELEAAIDSAAAEALAAFGNGQVFLERWLGGARHIEIQVLADAHGHVVHLGERECSVQRRHQKIIEEAPSPVVDAGLRERMGTAAVQAVQSIAHPGYLGVGTVEFLVDEAGAFYFLEMNTRLQVEHPVTELVTGHDLVAWQFRVAQSEALDFDQDAVRLVGHAIEARLYAEDPGRGFLPQTGRLARWRVPEGEGVRVDAGVAEGNGVSSHYDPMLAKIIAHGPDRQTARRRLLRALNGMQVLGVTTNRRFLAELLDDPAFVEARVKTDTIDARGDTGSPAPSDTQWAIACAVRCAADHAGLGASQESWASSGVAAMPLSLCCGDARRSFLAEFVGAGVLEVRALASSEDGSPVRVELLGDDRVCVAGVRWQIAATVQGPSLWLHDGVDTFEFIEPDPRVVLTEVSDGVITAALAGTVRSISVAVGDVVEAGQTLLTIEAMKMEHRLRAPLAGTVTSVGASSGDQVRGGQVVLQISLNDAAQGVPQ